MDFYIVGIGIAFLREDPQSAPGWARARNYRMKEAGWAIKSIIVDWLLEGV